MANTKINNRTIRSTLLNAGIEWKSASTTVFMPSFVETTLRGLKALSALNDLTKEILVPKKASRSHVRTEKNTIIKSSIFQGSLR